MSDPTLKSGYTLLFDIVVNDTNYMTAIVYGLVYRHSQMRNHACYASIGTMARLVGVSRRTIERHLTILVEKGFINKLAPDLAGHPYRYIPTDKVLLLMEARKKLAEIIPEESEVSSRDLGVRQCDAGVRQGDAGVRQGDVGVRQNVAGGYDTESQGIRQDVVQGDYIGDKIIDKRGIQEREGSLSYPSEHSEHLEDSQELVKTLNIKDNKENNKERKQSEIIPNITKPGRDMGLLSKKQRIALEALGNAMNLNFTLHKKAPIVADFLIGAYAKCQGPYQYAKWVKENGMHKTEMSRYVAFPTDIIAEYPQAFADGIKWDAEDEKLFKNEQNDFHSEIAKYPEDPDIRYFKQFSKELD